MAEKPNDNILKDFHEILQRCCKLEDTLLRNVELLNCMKNSKASAAKDLENDKEKLLVLRRKTNALESEMKKLTTNDFVNGESDLESLKKRCARTEKIYEKSKEKFQQLLQEIEEEK